MYCSASAPDWMRSSCRIDTAARRGLALWSARGLDWSVTERVGWLRGGPFYRPPSALPDPVGAGAPGTGSWPPGKCVVYEQPPQHSLPSPLCGAAVVAG